MMVIFHNRKAQLYCNGFHHGRHENAAKNGLFPAREIDVIISGWQPCLVLFLFSITSTHFTLPFVGEG